jgi:hypothetical protein
MAYGQNDFRLASLTGIHIGAWFTLGVAIIQRL